MQKRFGHQIKPFLFQLSLQKGQSVQILQQTNNEWWWAKSDGCHGYVPVTYLTASKDQKWQDEEYFGNYGTLVVLFLSVDKIYTKNNYTPTNEMRLGYTVISRSGGWSFHLMLCLKLLP